MMRTAIVKLKDNLATHGQHPGLLLQRYLSGNATGDDGNSKEKRAVLQAAIKAAASKEVLGIYESAFKRWQVLLGF